MVGRGITLCGPILTPLIEKRRRRSFLRGIPTHSAIEIVVGALRQDKGPAPAFRSVLSRLGELRQAGFGSFFPRRNGACLFPTQGSSYPRNGRVTTGSCCEHNPAQSHK